MYEALFIVGWIVAAKQREEEASRDGWHGQIFKRVAPLREGEG